MYILMYLVKLSYKINSLSFKMQWIFKDINKKTGKKTLKVIFLGFSLEKKGRRPEFKCVYFYNHTRYDFD